LEECEEIELLAVSHEVCLRVANLTPRMRNLLALLWDEWKELERQIVEMNMEVEQIASSDAACQRLQRIPGIGPLIATAIVAAIGNGAAFRKGREFAAWMGLVPRQYSTGGKAKLFGISKRGNRYLRKILIHGARAAVLVVTKHRISAFAGTDLEMILRTRKIDTLILFGLATSGVVLSTLLHASDNDHRLIIVKDCCADLDAAGHSYLIERFFPRLATVTTSDQLLNTLGLR
jgi:Isochorismatase family/Transposase IS116/IS110/IS902 family